MILYSWLLYSNQLVIVQCRVHAHPVTLVVFFEVTEKVEKGLSWIINLLLDVSV